MIKPGELSVALALGWSLLLTLGLFSVNVTISALFGASNLAVIVAGPVELLLVLPAARFIARLYVERQPDQALALAPVSPLELLIGVSLGVIIHLPIGYVSALVERRFPTPPGELRAELAMLTPSSTPAAIGMVVSVALIAALAEELYFRGALFTALERKNPAAVTIVTTSVAFALAHPRPRDWAALFVVALLLGEVRRRAASIWSGVALHAAFNATTLLFLFMTRPLEVKPQEGGSWQLAIIGGVLTLGGVWLFGRVASRRLGEAS